MNLLRAQQAQREKADKDKKGKWSTLFKKHNYSSISSSHLINILHTIITITSSLSEGTLDCNSRTRFININGERKKTIFSVPIDTISLFHPIMQMRSIFNMRAFFVCWGCWLFPTQKLLSPFLFLVVILQFSQNFKELMLVCFCFPAWKTWFHFWFQNRMAWFSVKSQHTMNIKFFILILIGFIENKLLFYFLITHFSHTTHLSFRRILNNPMWFLLVSMTVPEFNSIIAHR